MSESQIHRVTLRKAGRRLSTARQVKLLDTVWEFGAQQFGRALEQWSRANEGELITPQGARQQIAQELAVLCEALGPWADVDAKLLFEHRENFAEEQENISLRHWLEEGFGEDDESSGQSE